MSRKSTCFAALLLTLFLSFPAHAQQLTPTDAKAMLDKIGQASTSDELTLTEQQEQQLNSLPADVRSSVPIASTNPCVLNAGDSRVKSHQFVVCKGILPVGFGPKQSAYDVKLTRAFPWHIVTVDLNTDPTDDPQTKVVQYLWEYDFTGLPQQVQDILKGAAPHPGRSLFRLDGGAWKWVSYQ